jgi:hypothetical protein
MKEQGNTRLNPQLIKCVVYIWTKQTAILICNARKKQIRRDGQAANTDQYFKLNLLK